MNQLTARLYACLEIGMVSAYLGLTSFGGPAAHLGYFHNEYVVKRKWISEQSYGDLVALCQFLPGPASSQAGMGIGMMRAGIPGAIAAWLGFTLPSAILLILFALLMHGRDMGDSAWIHGLKLTAVAIVAQAVLMMGQKLAHTKTLATIAVLTAGTALLWQSPVSQIVLIAVSGLAGWLRYRDQPAAAEPSPGIKLNRKAGVLLISLFVLLLIVLPLLRGVVDAHLFDLFDSFYRTGSLVFGGGHVVLPLLQHEVVQSNWVSQTDFLAGYGAAQAVPGPLFTFASYLGMISEGLPGAITATAAIFLPAFLLIAGALPFWNELRGRAGIQGIMKGVNAAVVGLLLAALYNPIWVSAVHAPKDFALAAVLFIMLVVWKVPPWAAAGAGALGGMLLLWI
ncbi:chromate transporter [Paenibacillus sp. R14(2021)]|uniref:chromate transporter n=1 Tax=Paenibacillus sp. R14(2021) TaxID=2859228 RepID=UPI001C61145D|nr:chromate transporter [Paenibacillus sp. R14(2021)]